MRLAKDGGVDEDGGSVRGGVKRGGTTPPEIPWVPTVQESYRPK